MARSRSSNKMNAADSASGRIQEGKATLEDRKGRMESLSDLRAGRKHDPKMARILIDNNRALRADVRDTVRRTVKRYASPDGAVKGRPKAANDGYSKTWLLWERTKLRKTEMANKVSNQIQKKQNDLIKGVVTALKKGKDKARAGASEMGMSARGLVQRARISGAMLTADGKQLSKAGVEATRKMISRINDTMMTVIHRSTRGPEGKRSSREAAQSLKKALGKSTGMLLRFFSGILSPKQFGIFKNRFASNFRNKLGGMGKGAMGGGILGGLLGGSAKIAGGIGAGLAIGGRVLVRGVIGSIIGALATALGSVPLAITAALAGVGILVWKYLLPQSAKDAISSTVSGWSTKIIEGFKTVGSLLSNWIGKAVDWVMGNNPLGGGSYTDQMTKEEKARVNRKTAEGAGAGAIIGGSVGGVPGAVIGGAIGGAVGRGQAIQDWVAKGEAGKGGYDALNGSRGRATTASKELGKPATQMTFGEAERTTRSKYGAAGGGTGAIGRYQIIPDTMKQIINDPRSGITASTKFDQAGQDKAFDYLMRFKAGGTGVKPSDSPETAVYKMSKEWASIAVPRGMKLRNGRISDGTQSYYAGVQGNKAHILADDLIAEIRAAGGTGPYLRNNKRRDAVGRGESGRKSKPKTSTPGQAMDLAMNTYAATGMAGMAMMMGNKLSGRPLDPQYNGRRRAGAARRSQSGGRANGSVSSSYGMRSNPMTGKRSMHHGVDYAMNVGTPVYSSGDGKVTESAFKGANGNIVRVVHPGGWETAYIHLDKRLVKVGDTVRKGQRIALSGNTGSSTGPHLHYQVKKGGRVVNPNMMPYSSTPAGDILAAHDKALQANTPSTRDSGVMLDGTPAAPTGSIAPSKPSDAYRSAFEAAGMGVATTRDSSGVLRHSNVVADNWKNGMQELVKSLTSTTREAIENKEVKAKEGKTSSSMPAGGGKDKPSVYSIYLAVEDIGLVALLSSGNPSHLE